LSQHRPKVDQIIVTEPEASYSTGYQDEVIILPPEQEEAVQIESKRSLAFSLALRVAGLITGLALALSFLSHYIQADLAMLRNSSVALLLVSGLVILSLCRIYAKSLKDQTLSVDEIRVKASSVLLKPLISYLGWTFFFFVFGFLGPTWFRWVAAWFIFNAGSHVKFRSGGFMNMSSWPAGSARFSSFRVKR
jgi:hypothetical protein